MGALRCGKSRAGGQLEQEALASHAGCNAVTPGDNKRGTAVHATPDGAALEAPPAKRAATGGVNEARERQKAELAAELQRKEAELAAARAELKRRQQGAQSDA